MISPILGIDLGTTFSLVSVLRDGRPEVLSNAMGEHLMPSAVSVDEDGSILVGGAALARATTHPELTAIGFKRDMGTSRIVHLGNRSFRPEELSAMVLLTLKHEAEARIGRRFEEAVITVPAYFGEAQRQATRDAAAIAGLRAERIINEPTAAALAYSMHQRERELRGIVLDLGGGTFDVTVLEIMEGVVEIRASSGDVRLGGEDFTTTVMDLAAERMGLHCAGLSRHSLARLRKACERAKQTLSRELVARIELPALVVGTDTPDMECQLSRAEVEAAWTPLMERLRGPVRTALRDAGLRPDQLEEVLLVGGATRMGCVIHLARELFGREPLTSLPADEAVALGAAVQAGLKAGDASVSDVVVTDVAPFTLGISTSAQFAKKRIDGVFTPILERGTVLPASRVERFFPVDAQQTLIVVEVFQGEHAMCRDNTRLGSYEVKDIPLHTERGVDVRFTYDLNGLLEVESTVVATGSKACLVIERTPNQLSQEQLSAARERMQQLKFHPRESLPNRTALSRGDGLYQELTGAARSELGERLAAFRAALETQDQRAIAELRDSLVTLTRALSSS